jgi:NAD(P)-dependent dehydrogenase (short-subunit alcohol dehydrogenase family)
MATKQPPPQHQDQRPGHESEMDPQPEEVAACFVFLASEDASSIAGRILHPNGGEVVNG